MYGAIEFMRAWRELCKENRCTTCTANRVCQYTSPTGYSDETINELIGIVMRRKAQREKEETK